MSPAATTDIFSFLSSMQHIFPAVLTSSLVILFPVRQKTDLFIHHIKYLPVKESDSLFWRLMPLAVTTTASTGSSLSSIDTISTSAFLSIPYATVISVSFSSSRRVSQNNQINFYPPVNFPTAPAPITASVNADITEITDFFIVFSSFFY